MNEDPPIDWEQLTEFLANRFTECPRCGSHMRIAGFEPSAPGDETHVNTAYECSGCGFTAMELAPIGPIIPSRTTCLRCGAPRDLESGDCLGCKMPENDIQAEIGPLFPPPDAPEKAQERLRVGDVRRAAAIANAALLEDFQLEAAWMVKQNVYQVLGFEESLNQMADLGLEAGGPQALHFIKGLALSRKQMHREAIAAISRYVLTGQQALLPMALHQQANSYWVLGEIPSAEKLLQKAIELNPNCGSYYATYARLSGSQQRWPEAVAAAKSALHVLEDPGHRFDLFCILSDAQMRLQDFPAAEDAAIEALKLFDGDPLPWHVRGGATLMQGRRAEARSFFQKASDLNPEFQPARIMLVQMDSVVE